MEFPVFRKYPDNKTYFKVHSYESFEEIKAMGGFYQVHHYKAEKLPDRNLIEDMINLEGNFWEECDEEEFEKFREYCREHLEQLS